MTTSSQSTPVTRHHRDSSTSNTLDRILFTVRLHDRALKTIPNAPYLLTIANSRFTGQADGDGWLERQIPLSADDCMVYWSRPVEGQPAPAREADFEFNLRVFVRIDDSDREEALRRRLHNAGFPYESGDEQRKRGAVMSFQAAYEGRGLDPTGDMNDDTWNVLEELHDTAALEVDQSDGGGQAGPTDSTG
jgi:hypothetical protein